MNLTRFCWLRSFAIAFIVFMLQHNVGMSQIDRHSTQETKNLYKNLKTFSKDHLIFGHHSSVCMGIGWRTEDTLNWNSDVKKAIGDFPGLYGFDFIDGIDNRKLQVEKIFNLGGIITISWHADNPVTGGRYNDKDGDAMHSILPGQPYNDIWKSRLKEVAVFFKSLDVKGIKVPIIFRPFHENTNGHFWWSDHEVPAETFVKVWQYTVSYLRDTMNVHNLLYAYSPTRPVQLGGLYDGNYPGDEWVDIIGFDIYWGGEDISQMILENSREIVQFADERDKLAAITEAGIGNGIINAEIDDWFTRCILNPVMNDPVATKIAYFMTWRNLNNERHWVPLPGEPLHSDFVNFYDHEMTVFHRELPDMYFSEIYKK